MEEMKRVLMGGCDDVIVHSDSASVAARAFVALRGHRRRAEGVRLMRGITGLPMWECRQLIDEARAAQMEEDAESLGRTAVELRAGLRSLGAGDGQAACPGPIVPGAHGPAMTRYAERWQQGARTYARTQDVAEARWLLSLGDIGIRFDRMSEETAAKAAIELTGPGRIDDEKVRILCDHTDLAEGDARRLLVEVRNEHYLGELEAEVDELGAQVNRLRIELLEARLAAMAGDGRAGGDAGREDGPGEAGDEGADPEVLALAHEMRELGEADGLVAHVGRLGRDEDKYFVTSCGDDWDDGTEGYLITDDYGDMDLVHVPGILEAAEEIVRAVRRKDAELDARKADQAGQGDR